MRPGLTGGRYASLGILALFWPGRGVGAGATSEFHVVSQRARLGLSNQETSQICGGLVVRASNISKGNNFCVFIADMTRMLTCCDRSNSERAYDQCD